MKKIFQSKLDTTRLLMKRYFPFLFQPSYKRRNKVLFQKDFTNLDIIVFYVIPDFEVKAGGILSIFFLMENTKVLLPKRFTILGTIGTIVNYKKFNWFQNNYPLYNLKYARNLENANSLLIHIPEVWFEKFCIDLQKHKLQHVARIMIVNILNQNPELMPNDDIVFKYKSLFKQITMTLAFDSKSHFSYLEHPPSYISSWFYSDAIEEVPFEEKLDLAIISPDSHPIKPRFMQLLESNGIRTVEIVDMPYEDFKQLQRAAKWSFSFGEGLDNYSAGIFWKSGVGFGVFNDVFFPENFREALPKFFYSSYEEMYSCIINDLTKLNNPQTYEAYSKQVRTLILENNNPEFVKNNLMKYYKIVFN